MSGVHCLLCVVATPSPTAGHDLYNASRHGDLESVKRILAAEHVVDINTRSEEWSWTPVMAAAFYGHRDVVEFLVGRRADESLLDSEGDNVLHLAYIKGHLETVKLILSLNVDINVGNNFGNSSRLGESLWTSASVGSPGVTWYSLKSVLV
ncbi:ankyrin repeat and SOCS box protein 1-like [Haliotis asinina]|uniref:ankyrin repeat and SOCS box protein 1-like n=1 Tax=Haliotis asinina TaxID=109174 RepID=UPI0035320827